MAKKDFESLIKLAEKLRSQTGCPWDREQTISSMLKCLEDEACEVRQAIENGDHENLKEELGDLLFQIVMITQIARENKYFDFDQVIAGIHEKIVSRHTWIFGKDKAETPQEAILMWQKNKQKERNRKKDVGTKQTLGNKKSQ